MNKLLKVFSCLICLLMLAGCKENDPDIPVGITSPINKLALITADTELELDFDYYNVWDGIVSCSESNGLNYSYYRPAEMTFEAITQQFEYAIQDGATVIMCMGEEFAPVIKNLQDKHPNIKFIIINASSEDMGTLNSNVHAIMFRQEQGGYLAGYGAVKDGFTKLGYMGDHISEAYTSYANGFIQGANDAAKELNKPIEITVGYTTSYENKDVAVNAIDTWYKDGIEMILLSSDDAFIEKCAEKAVNNFGYLMGTNNDLSHLGANLDYNPFMTSAMKGLREAVDATLEMMLAGAWNDQLGGKTIYFGLQNGNYIYLPEYEATWLFKDFTLKEYHNLKTKISQGEILIDGTKLPEVHQNLVTLKIIE